MTPKKVSLGRRARRRNSDGQGGAPDWRCFDKNGAIVAFIAEIIAGSLRDKQKLPLVEPLLHPAADGGNLAECVRIAWTLFKLPPNSKPQKISRPLVGVRSLRLMGISVMSEDKSIGKAERQEGQGAHAPCKPERNVTASEAFEAAVKMAFLSVFMTVSQWSRYCA